MKINKSLILDINFALLMFTIFISLNDLTYLLFGVQRLASPLILINAIAILTIGGIDRKSFGNMPVLLCYGTYMLFFTISTLVRLYRIDIGYQMIFSENIERAITGFVITLTVHQYCFRRLIIDRKEKLVFNLIYIPILLHCLYAVYQSFAGIVSVTGEKYGRIMGFFSNPNALGMISNFGLMMTFYAMYKYPGKLLWRIASLAMFIFVSFLSLSRSSMVTAVFLLAFGIMYMSLKFVTLNKQTRRRHYLAGGIPLVALLYLVLNFETLVVKHLDYGQAKKILNTIDLIVYGKVTKENTSDRANVFEVGLKKIFERPIFGNGISYFQKFPPDTGYNFGVHNTYLLVWGEAGIFAFLLFIAFLLYMFISSIVLPGINGYLLFSLFSIFALQAMGSHNCLDEKIWNIIIMYGCVFILQFKDPYKNIYEVSS